MSEWQDIATAPKDGRMILLFRPSGMTLAVSIGAYGSDECAKKPRPFWTDAHHFMGRLWMRDNQPTHWMPLPEPPAAPQEPRS